MLVLYILSFILIILYAPIFVDLLNNMHLISFIKKPVLLLLSMDLNRLVNVQVDDINWAQAQGWSSGHPSERNSN